MGRVNHCWRDACAAALAESDPENVVGRLQYAITALERRYAEWGSDPGTPAELNAIRQAVFALERRMKKKIEMNSAGPPPTEGRISAETEPGVADALNNVRRLLVVLRS